MGIFLFFLFGPKWYIFIKQLEMQTTTVKLLSDKQIAGDNPSILETCI